MNIVVRKYGGSSLNTVDKIRAIARSLKKSKNKTVLVLSAPGKRTNELIKKAYRISKKPDLREMDMLLSIGERESIALLSIALKNEGIKALSFTGSQVGIITDINHTRARIKQIKGARLIKALINGYIPIIAGFQGVSEMKEITTLGRGGSDTTAIALSIFLKAKKCEFYKDVDGIYTEDPFIFKEAKHIPYISYEELIELSSNGANVIHPRAVLLAKRYHMPINVKKSPSSTKKTLIGEEISLEDRWVTAITHKSSLARLNIINMQKMPLYVPQVVSLLSNNGVSVYFYSHAHPSKDGIFSLSFIIAEEDLKKAEDIVKGAGFKGNIIKEKDVSSISLVGPDIYERKEVMENIFNLFNKEKIHIEAFSTSRLRITFYIKSKRMDIFLFA